MAVRTSIMLINYVFYLKPTPVITITIKIYVITMSKIMITEAAQKEVVHL